MPPRSLASVPASSEFAATLPRDPRGIAMGGCAGGLSGGLYGAFGAHLRPGARFVLEPRRLPRRLAAPTP